MEGDLPSQFSSLLVLLEGSNHNLLWLLLQIQRSKVKFCISATTNRPSTGMMKQPRWQECGIGRERGPGCRLRAMKRRGGLELAVSWGLVAIRTRYYSCLLAVFLIPPLLPDVLPRLPSSIGWNATTARPMSMDPSVTSMGDPGRPRFGWVLKEGSWYSLSDIADSNRRGQGCIVQSWGSLSDPKPKCKTLISSCQLDITAWIFRNTSSQHFPSLALWTSNHTYSFFQCFSFLSPHLETWRSLLILPSPSLCSPFVSRFWALLWE